MTEPNTSQPQDEQTTEIKSPSVAVEETPVEAFQRTFATEQQKAIARIGVVTALLGMLALLMYLLSPEIELAHVANIGTELDLPEQSLSARQFPRVSLEAKSAIVYDIGNNKVLYAKNPDAQLPLASITKLMTVLVAADLFHNEGLMAFGREELASSSNTSATPSTYWIPSDVLTYTLIQSSNLGAATIASAVGSTAPHSDEHTEAREIFVEKMNEKARELQLTQTYFLNESGLDETQTTGGGYGSARDAAKLIAALAESHLDILEPTRLPAREFRATDDSAMVGINTNTIVNSIPGLIGSKTGYTKLAGGNLVIVFDAGLGRPIAIAVLGSTEEGRFRDVQTLVNATIESLTTKPLTNTP